MVTATSPGLRIRRRENRVDFQTNQIAYQMVVPTLDRNRQYARGHIDACRVAQRHQAEKRADGCEPNVPGPHGVPAILFDAIEEPQNDRSLHIRQCEMGRFHAN